ncbi:hypothetical protein IQ07DRAFT_594472 [Pyrenochaeta sp. DS3sAY3a]|nr:hypothetical protein IQ07DRAFT_594472 [Pyrenochaeta sp. DS3sAY3a]
MAIEAQIYERLGVHPRLVQFKHWDPVGYALTLEYMPNGNLKEYLQRHGQEISLFRRQHLKICDFGGSSLDGSQATVAPGVRYRLPSLDGMAVKEDLFALGSTIYFIATGHEPFEELTDEDQVEKLYKDGVFPELTGVPFAEIIALCWRQEAESAKMVMELEMGSSEKCHSA